MTHPTPDDARIREAAYLLWLDEGQPQGRDQEHWLRAIDALTPAAPKKAARKAPAKPRAPKAKAAGTSDAAAAPKAKTPAKAAASKAKPAAKAAKSDAKPAAAKKPRASRAKAKPTTA